MKILGVDPSLKSTGLVLYDTKTRRVIYKQLKIKSKPGFAHLVDLRNEVARYVKKFSPKLVAIETPIIYRGRINGATRIFYYHSLLRSLFLDLNLPVVEYEPKRWKKLFTDHGDADKGKTIYTALTVYGKKFYSHDVCDAFALAVVASKDKSPKRI